MAAKIPGPGDYETKLTNRGLPLRSVKGGQVAASDRVTELDVLQVDAPPPPPPQSELAPRKTPPPHSQARSGFYALNFIGQLAWVRS